MRQLLLIATASAIGTFGAAQMPSGYYEVAPTPLPDSLREVMAGGRFKITLTRSASATERQLIERAEGLMPSPDVIAKSMEGLTGAGHVAAFQEAAKLPGDRWWWREWDGALLPVAITGRAVVHYIERVRILASGPNPFAKYNRGVKHSAEMEYTARVVLNSATNRREVHMKLSFSFYCGSECAMSFTHSRVVEFDESGNVLAAQGDGRPSLLVS